MENIYIPRISLELIRRNTNSATVIMPFLSYEIILQLDDSCGTHEDLRRSFIHIYETQQGKEVTDLFTSEPGQTLAGTTENLLNVMSKIKELSND